MKKIELKKSATMLFRWRYDNCVTVKRHQNPSELFHFALRVFFLHTILKLLNVNQESC